MWLPNNEFCVAGVNGKSVSRLLKSRPENHVSDYFDAAELVKCKLYVCSERTRGLINDAHTLSGSRNMYCTTIVRNTYMTQYTGF